MNWFNDESVQRHLTELLDRLCTLERQGGDSYGSILVFIPAKSQLPILCAIDGKPWCPYENMTYLDVEMVVKTALKAKEAQLKV